MLFPQERKSTGGILMQEPALWINWQQKTPNIERKEPEGSQKIAKLIKYLNAGQIMGWVFLLMRHGFLMSIKGGEKVKRVLRKRTSCFRSTRKICSDHHPIAWIAGSLWTQVIYTYKFLHALQHGELWFLLLHQEMTTTTAGSETTPGISLLISSTKKSRICSAFPLLCLPECVHLLLGDDSALLSRALLRLQDLHLHLQLQETKGVSSSSTGKGHMNSKGRRKSWSSAQVRLLMIQMWSTNSLMLNVRTSLNPAFLHNSFCLPQHFLHSRWGTESWMLLAKFLLLFQIFPLFFPMDNRMQKTLCGIRSSLGPEI